MGVKKTLCALYANFLRVVLQEGICCLSFLDQRVLNIIKSNSFWPPCLQKRILHSIGSFLAALGTYEDIKLDHDKIDIPIMLTLI